MTEIIKRDGSRKSFDAARIVKAVKSALNDAHIKDDAFAEYVAKKVESTVAGQTQVDIYNIQDQVEHLMMSSEYHDAARKYIEYRQTRDIQRESRNTLSKDILSIINQDNEELMNDSCYSCGYEGEFEATSRGFEYPQCKNRDSGKMSVTRRVCGYLGQPNSRPFNVLFHDQTFHRLLIETEPRLNTRDNINHCTLMAALFAPTPLPVQFAPSLPVIS